jgi:malate dehydrogenase
VLVVGNPANTNAYIAMKSLGPASQELHRHAAPGPQPRPVASGCQDRHPVKDIEKLTVWGNHSPTMYADYRFATVNGKSSRTDQRPGMERQRVPATVGKRGAAIIEARGLSSAASAANAAIDHMHDWVLGTNGKWTTMGIPSDGSYGIPEGTVFGFPVTTENGEYKIVQGLEIDAFSQERINITLKELTEEREGVKHLLP